MLIFAFILFMRPRKTVVNIISIIDLKTLWELTLQKLKQLRKVIKSSSSHTVNLAAVQDSTFPIAGPSSTL